MQTHTHTHTHTETDTDTDTHTHVHTYTQSYKWSYRVILASYSADQLGSSSESPVNSRGLGISLMAEVNKED